MLRKVMLFDADDYLASEVTFGASDTASAHLAYLATLGAVMYSEQGDTSLWALPDGTVAMLAYIR